MSKMKSVYQAMKECNWKGTPEEYLKWWIENEAKKIDKKKEKKWPYHKEVIETLKK